MQPRSLNKPKFYSQTDLNKTSVCFLFHYFWPVLPLQWPGIVAQLWLGVITPKEEMQPLQFSVNFSCVKVFPYAETLLQGQTDKILARLMLSIITAGLAYGLHYIWPLTTLQTSHIVKDHTSSCNLARTKSLHNKWHSTKCNANRSLDSPHVFIILLIFALQFSACSQLSSISQPFLYVTNGCSITHIAK